MHADLSRRTLSVERDGKTVRRFGIAVGRKGNPTPEGRFSVTDKLRVTDPGSPYGCCVLALSGHQTRLPAKLARRRPPGRARHARAVEPRQAGEPRLHARDLVAGALADQDDPARRAAVRQGLISRTAAPARSMSVNLPPFQALLEEYRADVYRFLVATAGPSEADDAFQETWIAALRAYPRLRRADNLRAWLFRIAQNKSIDAHRARGRRAVPVAAVPERPRRRSPDEDPELWARVRELPAKQRTAVFCRERARDAVRRACGAPREQRGRRPAQRPRGAEAPERGTEQMTDIEQQLREAALDLPDRRAALAERADEEGLLDVAYTSVDSPLGPLVVAATPKGLVRVSYSEFRGEDEVLEELARRVSPRVLEAPARLDGVRRELDEYFEGRREGFDTPIDWSYLAGFTREVLRATARDRVRRGVDLRRRRRGRGQPARGPRGRQRAGREPDAGDRPVPPRAAHRRVARRLHGRARAQGIPTAPGGHAALASGPSGEVAEWLKALAC